jgi:hypothetical protein
MSVTLQRSKDNPWKLTTPPGTSAYTMHTDVMDGTPIRVPPAVDGSPWVVRIGAQRQEQPHARQRTLKGIRRRSGVALLSTRSNMSTSNG